MIWYWRKKRSTSIVSAWLRVITWWRWSFRSGVGVLSRLCFSNSSIRIIICLEWITARCLRVIRPRVGVCVMVFSWSTFRIGCRWCWIVKTVTACGRHWRSVLPRSWEWSSFLICFSVWIYDVRRERSWSILKKIRSSKELKVWHIAVKGRLNQTPIHTVSFIFILYRSFSFGCHFKSSLTLSTDLML